MRDSEPGCWCRRARRSPPASAAGSRQAVVLEIAIAGEIDVEEVMPGGIDYDAALGHAMSIPRADDSKGLAGGGGVTAGVSGIEGRRGHAWKYGGGGHDLGGKRPGHIPCRRVGRRVVGIFANVVAGQLNWRAARLAGTSHQPSCM